MKTNAVMSPARAGTATLEILGEEIKRTLPIPPGATTVSDLLAAAGLPPRSGEWDVFVNDRAGAPGSIIAPERDVAVKFVPRTRGA